MSGGTAAGAGTPSASPTPFTPSAPAGARAQKQQETRRRILLAAAEIFADHGFAGASMDEVAERAQVGKGTIFYNFGSKQALFAGLVTTASTSLAEGVEAARDGVRGWDALERAADEVVRLVGEHPATAQLVVSELFRSGRPWADDLVRAREVLLTPFRGILSELVADREATGWVPVDAGAGQIDTVAVAVLGALVVSALDRALNAPDRPVEDLVAGLLLPLSGLAPGRPA